MKGHKEKFVNLHYSEMWAHDKSRKGLTFLETGWTMKTETKNVDFMLWNLTVAPWYNENLQEICAYLHN